MHTFELQRTIESLFSDSDSFQPFMEALSALAKSAEVIDTQLAGIAQGGAAQVQSAANIHSHLAHARQTTAAINNRQFFKALEHFQSAIARFQPPHTSDNKLIIGLKVRVEAVANHYDAFLSHQSAENALPLLLSAKALSTSLETFFDSLQMVEESVGAYDVPGNDEAPFALLLPAHLDMMEFARRLVAIKELYSELCMLLSVPESTHPLRISKIESGSLWAKVFGESRVVGMMVSFLEQTASWLFRRYTDEGKIASIPRKVEAIDALIGLTKRLEEAGVNTSDMHAHIEKSAIAISQSLSDILEGQSSVTVNEQTISVASEVQKRMLGRTAPRQLQNAVQPTPTDPPLLSPSD